MDKFVDEIVGGMGGTGGMGEVMWVEERGKKRGESVGDGDGALRIWGRGGKGRGGRGKGEGREGRGKGRERKGEGREREGKGTKQQIKLVCQGRMAAKVINISSKIDCQPSFEG